MQIQVDEMNTVDRTANQYGQYYRHRALANDGPNALYNTYHYNAIPNEWRKNISGLFLCPGFVPVTEVDYFNTTYAYTCVWDASPQKKGGVFIHNTPKGSGKFTNIVDGSVIVIDARADNCTNVSGLS